MAGNDHAVCKKEYGVAASWESLGSGLGSGFAPCAISPSLGWRPAPVWSPISVVRCYSIIITGFGIMCCHGRKAENASPWAALA